MRRQSFRMLVSYRCANTSPARPNARVNEGGCERPANYRVFWIAAIAASCFDFCMLVSML